MFDQAGLAYPRIGWTWDDFLDAAIQLTEREGGEVTRYGFVERIPYSYNLTAMVEQHNISLWDESSDPPRPLFDSPEVAQAIRRYADMALTYEVMPVPEIGGSVMAHDLINAGKAAMWTTDASDRGWHAERINLGLAPFPEGVTASNPRGMYGFSISAGTAHPEATWRWLSFLSANYRPSSNGHLPGRRSLAEELPWWTQLDENPGRP
jgi:multiple sugar transport system substrate-binding protein